MPLMRQGQEEKGVSQAGAYVDLQPDAPHATGTGGEGLLFGVCRGMPEEGEP